MSALPIPDQLLANGAALVVVKATIVLVFACVAGVVAKDVSAARRHLLWLVALSSCLWLAVSSPVVPAIVIHTALVAPVKAGQTTVDRDAYLPARPSAAAAAASNAGTLVNSHVATAARRAPIRLPRHPLVAVWIVGALTLIVRHLIGLLGAARFARRASVVSDAESKGELAYALSIVGLRKPVRLAYSADVTAPITFGIAKPSVLLPSEARTWPIERRRTVLIHEAAHIARGDWLAQSIGRLACDLFWFHPLAWRVFANLRSDAERAADDCVLRAGVTPTAYANHLLDVARGVNPRPQFATVGILSANDLERRFIAMFDAKRSRTMVTLRARTLATSAALAVLCPFASLHVAAPAQLNVPSRPSFREPPSPEISQSANRGLPPVERPDVEKSTELRLASMTVPDIEVARAIAVDSARPAHVPSRPDFAGKWRQDTTAGATVGALVNDSLIIRQSDNAISLEERGHAAHVPTYSPVATIPFGGAGIRRVAIVGADTAAVITSALWLGDTLVIDTHAAQCGCSHTIERLTLSADGNTLIAENLTTSGTAGARWTFGGPLTFVMRRIRN